MSQSLFITLVFLAVFAPVLIFSLVALFASGDPDAAIANESEEHFLLADRKINIGDYVNSSTGYMIQVSTTFYFVFWGYNYGFSNILYMISWALGILWFSLWARRLVEVRLLFTTIPSLISDEQHSYLQKWASIATILSFAGVFYVEGYFTADLISVIASSSADSNKNSSEWWAVFSIVVISVTLYSLLGGMRKVVDTDTWQLSFAYIGLGVVFSVLLHKTYQVSVSTGIVLSVICLLIYAILLLQDRALMEGKVKKYSILLSFISILGVTAVGMRADAFSLLSVSDINIPGLFHQVSEPWGVVTLFGFALLNIFWQFADSSNFQRIASLQLQGDEHDAERALKKAIRSLAIVSPLTWGLGIILGMLIRSAQISVNGIGSEYQGLVDFLRSEALTGSPIGLVALAGLVVGLVSIMMSTADSSLIAALQSYFVDLRKRGSFNQLHVTAFTLCFVLIVFALAYIHNNYASASILTIMAGAYSAIIVLAPLTLLRLMHFSIPSGVGSFAIIGGLIATGAATFGPIGGLPFNVQLVLPIFSGLGVSIAILCFAIPHMKREKNSVKQ